MYKPLRVALKSLWREFRRASYVHPPLFHEQIFAWEPTTLPKKTWDAFINAAVVRKKSGWETFHVFPNLQCCGRFFGNEAGLEEAKRLGESLFLVLCELDPALNREEGYFGFLNVLDDMAFKYPTPLLRVQLGVWEKVFDSSEHNELNYADWFDEQVSRWTTPENGGESYPTNPYSRTLVQNIFTSAMGAIQNILNPDDALLVGDNYDGLPFAHLIERKAARHLETASDMPVQDVSEIQEESKAQDISNVEQVLEPDKVEKEDTPPYQFQLKGDVWFLRFETEEGHFKELKGCHHIAKLLARPEKQIEALELTGEQDSPVANENLTPQFALSKKQINDCEKSIANLVQEIAQEEKSGHPARVLELKDQLRQFTEILKKSRGRRLGPGSLREKARNTVSEAIRRTKAKLKKTMPVFVTFLDRSIRTDQAAFAYCPPSPAPKWVL